MLSIVKESGVICDHIPKQIINSDFNLNFIGYVQKVWARVVVEKLISIVRLVIIEVALNTLLQRLC